VVNRLHKPPTLLHILVSKLAFLKLIVQIWYNILRALERILRHQGLKDLLRPRL